MNEQSAFQSAAVQVQNPGVLSILRAQPGAQGRTPHSCGGGPAQFNILPDKSGVPAETMRLDFCRIQVRPKPLMEAVLLAVAVEI
jgi:hypothetical protein